MAELYKVTKYLRHISLPEQKNMVSQQKNPVSQQKNRVKTAKSDKISSFLNSI